MRVEFGRCSFEGMEGFEVVADGSAAGLSLSDCPSHGGACGSSFCLTLVRVQRLYPSVADISENPEDLRIESFPSSIVLTTIPAEHAGSPLDLARTVIREMGKHLRQFELHFCHEDISSGLPFAMAQFSFNINFPLAQLIIVRQVGTELALTVMTVPPSEIITGWSVLRRFVESVLLT